MTSHERKCYPFQYQNSFCAGSIFSASFSSPKSSDCVSTSAFSCCYRWCWLIITISLSIVRVVELSSNQHTTQGLEWCDPSMWIWTVFSTFSTINEVLFSGADQILRSWCFSSIVKSLLSVPFCMNSLLSVNSYVTIDVRPTRILKLERKLQFRRAAAKAHRLVPCLDLPHVQPSYCLKRLNHEI